MRLINRLKDLNPALPGLLLGILLYGVLAEVIGIWFASDKIRYSTGLIIGIICAIGMAVHIASVIEDAVRFNGGTRQLSAKSVVRYVVIVIVFVAMLYFKLGSLISGFIGLLGLKVSAYAQPFLYKTILKKYAENLQPDNDNTFSQTDLDNEREKMINKHNPETKERYENQLQDDKEVKS